MNFPRHIRAGLLRVRGQHLAAAAEYRQAFESDPRDPAALIAVLDDCRRRGAIAEAIAASNRALAHDTSNFIALDGLAWAYLEQEDHHQAKIVVERAFKSLEEVDTEAPLRGVPKLMLGVVRLIAKLPGLRGRFPAVPPSSALVAEARRGATEWKTWAREYLAWYGHAMARNPQE